VKKYLVILALVTPSAALAAPSRHDGNPSAPSNVASVGSIPEFVDYQGSGTPGLLIPSTLTFGAAAAGPRDSQTFQVQRMVHYQGGMNGFTNSALSIFETVQPGARSFEWATRSFLDNFSTSEDSSQNAALYTRAIKESSGMTWSATSELDDTRPNPTTTSVTEEFDLEGKGGDSAGNRVILDLWGKSNDDAPDNISRAIRINSDVRTSFQDVIQFNLASGCTNFINDVATSRFKVDCNGGVTATYVAASYIHTKATTMSRLATVDPSPSSGDRALVTDAVTCVFAGFVTGGGSVTCPVYFDGTWKAG